jgi:hypothetical protein
MGSRISVTFGEPRYLRASYEPGIRIRGAMPAGANVAMSPRGVAPYTDGLQRDSRGRQHESWIQCARVG